MAKKTMKRKREVVEKPGEETGVPLPAKRQSDEPIPTKSKWTNKQRVLVLAARGISFRDRHLMEDLKKLMPHHKSEAKMERSKTLSVINEMCEIKNCNKAILFEGRRKKDLYLWFGNVPHGPSVKFLVENIYTMAELKLTGNCLRGSRPLLSFDPSFVEKPHYQLLKELLVQIFGVPNHHPKSQPFFDHVFNFTVLDNRIWFRNFQILNDEGALAEVGPRFVLNPVKIFSGSFAGVALWENPNYMSPAKHRRQINLSVKNKYVNRQDQKIHAEVTKPKESYKMTPLEDIFKGDAYERAHAIQKEIEVEKRKEDILDKKRAKQAKKELKKKAKTTEDEDANDSEENDNETVNENGFQEEDIDENEEETQLNIQNLKTALKKIKSLDKTKQKAKIVKKSPLKTKKPPVKSTKKSLAKTSKKSPTKIVAKIKKKTISK